MSRIFIDRPIFAWVIAIIIMLVGIGSITQLPVAQYPDIAPPQVNINTSYPGASADTLQNSVTQVLEQQLTGVDGMLYFSSSSSSSGSVTINAVFQKGIDPDIAQVQVQNAIQAAISRLPQQVQQQGVRVTKSNPDLLLIIGVSDTTDRATNVDVGDWMVNNLQYQIGRLPGVGNANVFGSQYAMRIWLDPAKLRAVQPPCRATLPPRSWRRIRRSRPARSAESRSPTRKCSTQPSRRSRGCRRPISSATSSSSRTLRARAFSSATSPGSSWARRIIPSSAV